ncbi:MAG: response regulator [Lachnospiraceae bacterium]|nr:response regulator [Lachnospiraceae bacterium]
MEDNTKKRILAVDDDETTLGFVSEVLSAQGCEVVCASGGAEAIEILKEQSFDGVVLDFYMPEKDGLDVIASMYGRKDRTPTIIFTSKLSPAYEAAVQGFGITREILYKSCTASQLAEAVKRVTGS